MEIFGHNDFHDRFVFTGIPGSVSFFFGKIAVWTEKVGEDVESLLFQKASQFFINCCQFLKITCKIFNFGLANDANSAGHAETLKLDLSRKKKIFYEWPNQFNCPALSDGQSG